MDKLVRRVTVLQGGSGHRAAKVVYVNDDDMDDDEQPAFHPLEHTIRHMLKAQLVAAQEAYESHLESVEKGGDAWIKEGPKHFRQATRKAMKEMRKASPFKMKPAKFEMKDDADMDAED